MLQKCDYNDKKAYTTHKEWQYIFIAVFHGFFMYLNVYGLYTRSVQLKSYLGEKYKQFQMAG